MAISRITDPLQGYLTAHKLKEQTANQLARDEGALARVLGQLRQETGLADVTEAEALLRQEQDKLIEMEKRFQEELNQFHERNQQRFGGT